MKRFRYLPAVLFLLLLLGGCGADSDTPTPETATFRVDITQAGDFGKFTKIISISGGDFYKTGTQEEMPVILFNEHLTAGSYSYEAAGVRELDIHSTIGFSAVETGPAAMALRVTVFRNGQQIDQKSFAYDQDSDETNEFLSYKAGE